MKYTVKITGGDKLEAALAEIRKKVGHDTVQVGILEGSTYPDGTSVPMVAAAQEFGTDTIPPRPFMRNAVRNNSPRWGELLGAALKMSELDGEKALMVTGLKIASQVQDEIVATNDPPLAPSTVKTKGFNTALVDIGTLLNSVGSEVGDDRRYPPPRGTTTGKR